jgi:hypothetical protein
METLATRSRRDEHGCASHGELPSTEVCELIYNRIPFSVTFVAPA